jgi:hypothetical protein
VIESAPVAPFVPVANTIAVLTAAAFAAPAAVSAVVANRTAPAVRVRRVAIDRLRPK